MNTLSGFFSYVKNAVRNQLLGISTSSSIHHISGCMPRRWSLVLLFVPFAPRWGSWDWDVSVQCKDVGYLGTGKHSGALHGPRDSDSSTTYKHTLSYSFISHIEDRDYVSHKTHTHTHTDPLFIPLNREWPRLGSNKEGGFTSGIRGASPPL